MTELRYTYDSDGIPLSATVPHYAFKFAAVNEYSISSLHDKYLWFSRPDEFNDIFELPVKARHDFSESELRSYLRANMTYHWPKFGIKLPDAQGLDALIDTLLAKAPGMIADMFQKLQSTRKELVRICCMSMRYDDPLMWAHYASSFTGICLVLDFPCLVNAGPWFPLQVKYVDQIPTFDPISSSLREHATARPYEEVAAQMEYDQMQFGIKLQAWSHEEELRLCTLSSEPKQHYPEEALIGVILGPRVSIEAEQSIVQVAKNFKNQLVIERLVVDVDNNLLRVPGLENKSVELKVAGVRNLLKRVVKRTPSEATPNPATTAGA